MASPWYKLLEHTRTFVEGLPLPDVSMQYAQVINEAKRPPRFTAHLLLFEVPTKYLLSKGIEFTRDHLAFPLGLSS